MEIIDSPGQGAWQDEARRVAGGIRRRVLEHTVKNNGGYLSQACSAAEILAAMYLKIMRLGSTEKPLVPPPFPGVPGPQNPHSITGAAFNGPRAPHLDRFILSPSQYALVVYAALIETGRMAPEGLDQFNRDGSTVEMIGAEHSPGMEVMTGSLGQGLSQAAGIAMARKRRGETGRVWLFMSDGEFQSGQNWEAMEAIAHHRLDNIGIYVDMNGQQCDGPTDTVLKIEPFHDRLAAFGARVFRVDGHDLDALAAPAALERDGRPLVVLADTDPCRELPLLQKRIPKLHYVRFASAAEREEYRAVLTDILTREP
ncbi:transketolase [Heliobacterium undosum]|uniref:Transketolase n=1 Tax=Heliomicrobium undosum TaxID=121734 RepID=A0A845L3S7_9FIRM|nr:1-deoxy-D-xylulose-5-phosphate synthase N-terminal domain-containing protein [Heliomicrobium undosum]MZP29799.1 transketolase [Heliomicrobium undosum]